MHDHQLIREAVSRDYVRALNSSGTGCCGSTPKGILARQAGYRDEELSEIPKDAVTNSFGCGNPLAFSQVAAGEVVLDLGCGAGIDLVIAAARVGRHGKVIGVDMTDEMVSRAREVIREAGLPNVEVRKGIIEELPVESGSVDWIISNCVINLSPEKERVFAEIARVLRPGGCVRVSDIIAENLSDETRQDMSMRSCCLAGALSETDYRSGLERAGLVDIEIQKTTEIDVEQFVELVGANDSAGGCCTGKRTSETLAVSEDRTKARAWSALIHARKPK